MQRRLFCAAQESLAGEDSMLRFIMVDVVEVVFLTPADIREEALVVETDESMRVRSLVEEELLLLMPLLLGVVRLRLLRVSDGRSVFLVAVVLLIGCVRLL